MGPSINARKLAPRRLAKEVEQGQAEEDDRGRGNELIGAEVPPR